MDLKRIERARETYNRLAEVYEALETTNSQIDTRNKRIADLRRFGRIPASEALREFEKSLDQFAERGRERLVNGIEKFTRAGQPRSAPKPTVASIFGLHKASIHGGQEDSSDVFVYLHRDALLGEGKTLIEELCTDSNVPEGEDARYQEISKLEGELKELEPQKAELERKAERLFKQLPEVMRPVHGTAIGQVSKDQETKALNELIEGRNKRRSGPSKKGSPVTVRDADGRDVTVKHSR